MDMWQRQLENSILIFKMINTVIQLGKQCFESLIKDKITATAIKLRFRQPGGGRKKSIPDV